MFSPDAVSVGLVRRVLLLLGFTAAAFIGLLAFGQGTASALWDPLVPVTAVAVGDRHDCALLSSGTVRCAGTNSAGQLGDGTTTNSSTPVVVSGLSGVTAISAGDYGSCAVLVVGTVKCWGANYYGQLGDGGTTNSSTPVQVPDVSGAIAVTSGQMHSCALLSDRTVKCWGYNDYGQLGAGWMASSRSTAVVVSGLSGVKAIAAGDRHTCALLSDGTARCWGSNSGSLGNGTIINSSTPVVVSGLTGATAIASGQTHSCALVSNGAAKC